VFGVGATGGAIAGAILARDTILATDAGTVLFAVLAAFAVVASVLGVALARRD
jgi:hypothetical protein